MGGDHITKHGTHISRDMGPGGGPYISNDMSLPGPMSLGKWGRGGGGGDHITKRGTHISRDMGPLLI